MKVPRFWAGLLLILFASGLATPFAHNLRITPAPVAAPLAPTGPVYQVSLDANSLSPTDTTVATNATQVKSFRIGAVVNSSASNPLSGVYAWQFGIVYNASAFYPLGDPNPASSYPDGAATTVNFGAQTTTGTVNWAGKIAASQAFGSFSILPCDSPPCRFQEIQVFTTLIAPTPAVTISAKTVLANVNFELVSRPGPPQQFNITDVKFVTQTGTELAGPVSGPPIIERITNAPPIAHFSTSPAPNISPFAFNFNASASSDPDGTIANPAGYFWDFGDGTQDLAATGSFVTHDYGADGTFIVTLRVQDNLGATGSARDSLGGPLANPQPSHEKRIVGTVPDKPPIAQFNFHADPSNSSLIFFDASNSTDPDGSIDSYHWELVDGFNVSTVFASITHAYRVAGNYTVNLTVFDNANLTGTVSHVVPAGAKADSPPIAIFTWSPATPTAGSPVYFFGNQSYDPDGSIQSYVWNFGDGTTGFGLTTTHTYSSAGFYSVLLIVTDNAGLTGQTLVTIHVVPVSNDVPPVALFTFSTGNATTGQGVTFFGASSYDPDGYIQSWYWSFGDGYTSFGATTSHAYSTAGVFTVTLTVTDNAGLTGTTLAVISVLSDRPPIAAFTFNPANPKVGQTVAFDASSSFDPDGFIQSDSWSFGDGSIGFGTFDQHTYFNAGNFTVTLTVTDNNGSTNSTSRIVSVQPKPLHDVSIVQVNVYPQRIVSSQSVGIQVVLTNNGSSNETVTVTEYYSGNVIATQSGIFVPAQSCNFFFCNNNVYVQIIWDTTGVPAGNYTISATVFLPTDQNPSDNTKTDGQIQVLPPPTMTTSPNSGVPGTTVTVHATGFPEIPYYYRATATILVTFDDQLVGFATQNEGTFNFTFSIPLSQPGAHQVKALDEISGAHVSVAFQVLSTPSTSTLTVSEQVGTIYFPQDTVVVYSQVTLNGVPTTPSSFQLQLSFPNGSSIILTTQSIGPGFYKSTYLVPKSGPVTGTYLLVGKAHNNTPLDASGIASFEVKQSWINSNSPRITAGATLAAVLGLSVFAWQRGYFRKKKDDSPTPL